MCCRMAIAQCSFTHTVLPYVAVLNSWFMSRYGATYDSPSSRSRPLSAPNLAGISRTCLARKAASSPPRSLFSWLQNAGKSAAFFPARENMASRTDDRSVRALSVRRTDGQRCESALAYCQRRRPGEDGWCHWTVACWPLRLQWRMVLTNRKDRCQFVKCSDD